jgi:hypothetical protein
MASCCEDCNEPLDYMKGGKCLNHLNDCKCLKKDHGVGSLIFTNDRWNQVQYEIKRDLKEKLCIL